MDLFDELSRKRKDPVLILHGTDWWTDTDDVIALRLLLNAHKAGAIRLLGIGVDSVMEYSAASVSAVCAYSGVNIPIGLDFGAERDGGKCRYQAVLASYPHPVRDNASCMPAVRLYRQQLAVAPYPVDITEVGFPQIISQLLLSGPDDISPLSGAALVREKVNRIWMMAGNWADPDIPEYNLSAYPVNAEAGHLICETCPVPVIFLGYEVGRDVITGRHVPENDVVSVALRANGRTDGNRSWDPMTVLAAVEGDPEQAGYSLVRGAASVDPLTGKCAFERRESGPHAYLVKNMPDAWYEARIDGLIQLLQN